MKLRRIAAMALLPVIGLVALAACAGDETNGPPGPSEPAESGGEPPSKREATRSAPPKENGMRIEITVGSQRFRATLADSQAARDLIAQLPQTVEMTDHGGVEKTGPLRAPLSTEGQPPGADPDVGDLGYYAPGHDLVLYYGNQSYFSGIVILGKLEDGAAARIAELAGSVTATVEERS